MVGNGGPGGSVVHIDNLDAKPQPVKTNTKIEDGDFCINDSGLRPIVAGDFPANDRFMDLSIIPIVLAAAGADNLDTTLVRERQTEVPVLRVITDWVTFMAAGVNPNFAVGIHRLDTYPGAFKWRIAAFANSLTPTNKEILGVYKGKRFSTIAEISVLEDDGIITTGVHA